MDTIYRKVEIKSEHDLPKEDKRFYFHLRSDSGLRNCRPDSSTFRQIKKRIDWYLQPVEPQDPKCEECPSRQFYEANTTKIMDKIEQPEISVTDEDIQNAASDYVGYDEDKDTLPIRYLSREQYAIKAYQEGAKDMRDNKIYISPKK